MLKENLAELAASPESVGLVPGSYLGPKTQESAFHQDALGGWHSRCAPWTEKWPLISRNY